MTSKFEALQISFKQEFYVLLKPKSGVDIGNSVLYVQFEDHRKSTSQSRH